MAIKLTKQQFLDAEIALEAAQTAQDIFWAALSDLEEILGFEVDSTRDLVNNDVATLIDEHNAEEEEEENG